MRRRVGVGFFVMVLVVAVILLGVAVVMGVVGVIVVGGGVVMVRFGDRRSMSRPGMGRLGFRRRKDHRTRALLAARA